MYFWLPKLKPKTQSWNLDLELRRSVANNPTYNNPASAVLKQVYKYKTSRQTKQTNSQNCVTMPIIVVICNASLLSTTIQLLPLLMARHSRIEYNCTKPPRTLASCSIYINCKKKRVVVYIYIYSLYFQWMFSSVWTSIRWVLNIWTVTSFNSI